MLYIEVYHTKSCKGANGERSLGEIMMILYEKAISRGFTDTRLKLVDFLNDYDFPNFPSSHDNSDWSELLFVKQI